MSVQLVPLSLGTAPTIAIERPVLLVGRHPDCDIRLDLPSVSRRHCCLALAYDRLVIRDLGSRHGVWVNGEKITERGLQVGDEVAIGPFIFRVVDPTAPAAAPVSAAAEPTPGRTRRPKPPSLPELDHPTGDLVPLSDLVPDL